MQRAKRYALTLFFMLLSSLATWAQTWQNLPNAPQPQPKPVTMNNDYAAGFSFDNQRYMLLGGVVSLSVGMISNRPWLGLASGVGSCALYRVIHIQGYHNDKFFGQNRMEFCAVGSLGGYGLMKLMHVHKRQ
jgi:hypothetical protein